VVQQDPELEISLQAALLAGTDVHLRDAWGYTALHWAASRGHEAVTALLLSKRVRSEMHSTAWQLAVLGSQQVSLRNEADGGMLCRGQQVADASRPLRYSTP